MATHTVEGLEITYDIDLVGSLGEWMSFIVQHLKGEGTTQVWFSRRRFLPAKIHNTVRAWLDSEWVRTRLAENPKDRAPFFSDKPLTTTGSP